MLSLALELLYYSGLRISSFISLKVKDVEFNEKTSKLTAREVKNRKNLQLYHIPSDLMSRIQKHLCVGSNIEDKLVPYSAYTLRKLLKKQSKLLLGK